MNTSILSNSRNIRVTTPLPLNALVFESMTGDEMLGRPFAFEVELLSESSEIDLQDLLGKPITIHVDVAQGTRHFNGIVTEFRIVGSVHRFTRYRASLRPELSLLAYSSDCRIFQNMTIPEIVERVLKNRHVTYLNEGVKGTYDQLEYVVQYRESDLNFVSRLMEHAGIFYYFVHEEGKHTMMLADEVSACKEAPGYETVPYLPPDDKDSDKIEHVTRWTAGARLVPGTFTVRDFRQDLPRDLPTASAKTIVQREDELPRAGADYEVYDYPGDHETADEARQEALTRLREHESWYQTAEAQANARGLGAGHKFKVLNLPRLLQNEKSYLIVKASYSLQIGDYESDGAADQPEYRVSFTLVDGRCEYRTPRETPRPRVQGPQTATVVRRKTDSKDEEICTDDDGRVLVKFHWDRRGEPNSPKDDPLDEDKEQSMFIRVSQVWAGAGWGASFIPRVGHEVVIDFLEGDPDRPLITGRVYNGDNKPPYPKNPTWSGIKTHSTKGGGANNYNEIRFEDAKGKEELHLQAERDQSTTVKADQSISVGHDRNLSVTHNETITVKEIRKTTVSIKEDQNFKLRTMKVETTDDEEVTEKRTVIVHGGRETTIEKGDILNVLASDKTTTVDGTYGIAAKTEFKVAQNDQNTFIIREGVQVETVGPVGIKNKTCQVEMKDGKVEITAAEEISLQCGQASIVLKKDGTIEIHGAQKVTTTGATSALELAGPGASLSGTKTSVSASAVNEITGAIVKIN